LAEEKNERDNHIRKARGLNRITQRREYSREYINAAPAVQTFKYGKTERCNHMRRSSQPTLVLRAALLMGRITG